MIFSGRPPIRQSPLGRWVAEHMPELDAELGPLSLDQVRTRLNAITGLNVLPSASIAESTDQYLEALKAMKEQPCKSNTSAK